MFVAAAKEIPRGGQPGTAPDVFQCRDRTNRDERNPASARPRPLKTSIRVGRSIRDQDPHAVGTGIQASPAVGVGQIQTSNHVTHVSGRDVQTDHAPAATVGSSIQDQQLVLVENVLSIGIHGDGDGWELIDDERALSLTFNEEDDDETLLVSEWIRRFGPGFLAAA